MGKNDLVKPERIRTRKKLNLRKWGPVYLMALPGLIYLIINNYMPLYGLQIAFRKLDFRKGVFHGDFVGFENFRFLFTTNAGWVMIRNTVLYNIVFIVTGIVFGLTVAILFNEMLNKKLAKTFQALILIPFFMSMVIVSYLSYAFLSGDSGFLNKSVLEPLGLDPVIWYSEPKYWPFILLFVHTWKQIGYSLLMYTTRLIAIDPTYYEAATIDGASKWQKIKYITIPLLKPAIIMMLILSIGKMFYSDFGLFYQIPMNSGALQDITTTIDVYSFRALMKLGDIPMSSATSTFQAVVGFILLSVANLIVRRLDKDQALY